MIDIDALLARNDGFILARDNRRLKSSLSRWVKQGRLARLIRGVYAHPDGPPTNRLRAATLAMPGAVIAGKTALAFAASKPIHGPIEVCTPTRRAPQPGYRFTRRTIPREHVREGVMSPALAAVDVCDRDPSWLDDLARRRIAATEDYQQLLTEFAHRVGNPARRRNIARTSTTPGQRPNAHTTTFSTHTASRAGSPTDRSASAMPPMRLTSPSPPRS